MAGPVRKVVRLLHLWLGLISGLVVVVLCLSGAMVAFFEEAIIIANREHLYVEKQDKPRASIEAIRENYERQYPNETLFVINSYREENRAYDFFSAVQTDEDTFGGYKMVYANPYTGEIIHVDRGTLEFIVVLLNVHTSLLLGEAGHWIIKGTTIVFLLQLIGGIILWWPTSLNAARSAFSLKLPASTKRLNYDMHRVLGFYASWVLLVVVTTGIFMAFRGVRDPITDVLGGKSALIGTEPPASVYQSNRATVTYQAIANRLYEDDLSIQQVCFLIPEHDTTTVIKGRTNTQVAFLTFEVGQRFQFDKYTGQRSEGRNEYYRARNDAILAGSLLIHMGLWGGVPTKLLALLVGLFGASLPVTGFLIWRNRIKSRRLRAFRVAS